ncbi:MAG: hypothetical protein IT462_09295 [Planctomycetes bacterium]|nr:hypothetical protein [Planctomycetota bacterium]
MLKWLSIFVALLFASSLTAQGSSGSTNLFDRDIGGAPAIDKQGLVEVGADRVGFGLDARAGAGHDDNIFNVDRHKEDGFFAEFFGKAHYGTKIFDLFEVGVRGRAVDRFYFDGAHEHHEDEAHDHHLWDVRLGGFLRHRAAKPGDLGFGVSADLIYQKARYYELTGPVLRFFKTNRTAIIGRVYGEYNVFSFMGLELGVTGSHSDFSEDNLVESPDYWNLGVDFGVYLRFWDFLQFKPYVGFEYDSFRDVLDQNDDGSISKTDDKLQLLRWRFGVEARVQIVELLTLMGRAYVARQDDSAQGFQRYTQYGAEVATQWKVSIVRIFGGLKAWAREYDDRFRFDSNLEQESVLEQFFGFYGEVRVNFFWRLYAGGRVDYDRRSSRIDNRGFANTQWQVFVGLDF